MRLWSLSENNDATFAGGKLDCLQEHLDDCGTIDWRPAFARGMGRDPLEPQNHPVEEPGKPYPVERPPEPAPNEDLHPVDPLSPDLPKI